MSLKLAKMQEEVISLMLQARNLMFPNEYFKQYVFFIPCKLNFIAIS